MKSNLTKMVIGEVILLLGILGFYVMKYLPTNIFGVVVLVFIGILRFGGLLLSIIYLIKFFSKEKPELDTLEEHEIVKKNKLLTYSVVPLVFGLLFCFSSFLVPYLCNKDDSICAIQSVGVEVLFFVPLGIVLITVGSIKLYRFFKKINVKS